MKKTRPRQFRRTCSAADGVTAFDQQHRATGLRQPNAGGQPIWSGAYDHRVVIVRHDGRITARSD